MLNLSNGQICPNDKSLERNIQMSEPSSSVDSQNISQEKNITTKYVSIEDDLESREFIENLLEHKRIQSELQRTHPRKTNPVETLSNGNQKRTSNLLLHSNNDQAKAENNNLNGINSIASVTTVVYADHNIPNSQ